VLGSIEKNYSLFSDTDAVAKNMQALVVIITICKLLYVVLLHLKVSKVAAAKSGASAKEDCKEDCKEGFRV
jgi:hypothetical protein